MKKPKDIQQAVKWSTDFGAIDLDGQLEMCREDIGTDREWQPITIHDEDGPAEVVALCHPINARLIAAAPQMLAALQAAANYLQKMGCEHEGSNNFEDPDCVVCAVFAAISRAKEAA